MGVPSKIKAVKVFDANEVELTDVVVTNSDDPPEVSIGAFEQETENRNNNPENQTCSFLLQSIITRAGQEATNLQAFVELYGTDENPTNLFVTHIQWGKDDDANMISCAA